MTQHEGLEKSVLPTKVDELAIPLPLDKLQPWHRPRKQYVREKQWQYYTRHLIRVLKKRNALKGGILNYFSFPGIDHFDVEVIGEVVTNAGLKLETLGFLSEAEKAPVKARSQVRLESLIKKDLIEDTSATVPYRIQDIVPVTGQAYREVERRAPFHIINIDACGSIAPPSAQHSDRIITALHHLVGLQLNQMRHPWLLFVTTDVRLDTLSCEVRSRLEDVIKRNAENSENFKQGAINCLGDANVDDLEDAINCAKDPLRFQSLFSLGFSKWLLHNAQVEKWDVECLRFYGYSTSQDARQISMPCLAYEFKPRPIDYNDQIRIVESPTPRPVKETDYSMRAIESTQKMKNIDCLFAKKPEMGVEYAKKQRDLLTNAGYQAATLKEFDSEYINNALETD